MREVLWQPSEERKQNSHMLRFMDFVNKKFGLICTAYDELYRWSIEEPTQFWQSVWEFAGIQASKPYTKVVENFDNMLESRWFLGAELNFAENLLRFRDDRTALIFKGEAGEVKRLSYAQLYNQVVRLAKALRAAGVEPGDRVAGFLPNIAETVIAMLATTSLGGVWSSCSQDFGIKGVLDRFGQIKPKVLIASDGYRYGGKAFDSLAKVEGIANQIKSIERIVIVPHLSTSPKVGHLPTAILFEEFLQQGQELEFSFAQLPFDHPLYIMYSSGTTGVPKCIVHGAGGVLIQHLKEHMLHTDLTRNDSIFYFTTCGWMMWNWLVSALAVGAKVVLYDGSPTFPDAGTLWQLAEEEGITVFGTSAKYLAVIEKEGLKPGKLYDLSRLKTILSTGSPLSEESFRYVYRDIKQDVCLASITGGTDLVSTFALGNPLLPVRLGELQSRGLGMKVESFDPEGKPVINQKGELVCTASFPVMPIYFWNDPGKEKYRKAYFSTYPNVWRHGDFIEITDTGGMIVYGRSDSTLNPGGVRIGTAEIYRQVELFEEVADSLVVGQNWKSDVRVILFLKLKEGADLSPQLTEQIKRTIRTNTTPRHVPAKIIAVADIPYTRNGKKVELAVKQVIEGDAVLNQDALANPEALDFFKDLPELKL